ncbi:hypothetical protein [Sphingobium yanoikuyae]|uniref:hypothetical protein n=1 Tax=Sphingobium yanoikuyae TaxID=13690 RepID=UPI002FDD975C
MFDPYALGALGPDHHDRLVADLDNFARDAGIQPHWIGTPLADDVTASERDYLRAFNRHAAEGEVAGLGHDARRIRLLVRCQKNEPDRNDLRGLICQL